MSDPEIAPGNTVLPWREKLCLWVIILGLALFPLFSHAGGLGLAPIAAIVGGVGILTVQRPNILRLPSWFWALTVFLIWVSISAFWSPYKHDAPLSNSIKLLIGAVLYLGTFLTFKTTIKSNATFLRHMLVAVCVLSMGLLLIDIMSGYALTFLIDPPATDEILARKRGDTEMNLGHAITVLAIFMAPIMMIIRHQVGMGWLLSPLFALMLAITAFFGQLMIGALAVLAAVIFMMLARLKPLGTLRFLIWVAIFSILMAPLMGYLLNFLPDTSKAVLPFSWEHRVEMWTYTADKILSAPIWGHGFDATRTFDETFSFRGVTWPIVSLHPHNAGLHIWVETGAIGAILAVITIMLMGFAAEGFIQQSRSRAVAVCGFLGAVIVINTATYGVWQDWWWAIIIFVAASLHVLPTREIKKET